MKPDAAWVGAEHGRHANSPTEIPPAGWKDILWRLYHEINDDRTFLVAAGVTYYMLLALVPALSVFVSLYGLFNDRSTVGAAPQLCSWACCRPGGIDILKDQLTRLTSTPNSTLSLTLVISLGVALWSASSGIKALFDAMNIAYDETEKRNFFRTQSPRLRLHSRRGFGGGRLPRRRRSHASRLQRTLSRQGLRMAHSRSSVTS